MSKAAVLFHPEAALEVLSARDWYKSRNPSAAMAFVEEVARAVERIARGPGAWPGHKYGTRRCFLRRFPFLIIYRPAGDSVEVVAVAHGRRKPGYWKDRIAST